MPPPAAAPPEPHHHRHLRAGLAAGSTAMSGTAMKPISTAISHHAGVIRLYINRRATGITLHPDDRFPWMFRIHWADGQVSKGTASLPWAKDAALRYVRPRGLGGKEQARWVLNRDSPAAVLPGPSQSTCSPRIGLCGTEMGISRTF